MAYVTSTRNRQNPLKSADFVNARVDDYLYYTSAYDETAKVGKALSLDPNDKGIHQTEAIIILFFVFLVIIGIFFLVEERVIDVVVQDLSTPTFILGVISVVLFMAFVFLRDRGNTAKELSESNRLETATKHAFIALIIAYLAHLDTYFLTFIIVFIFVYAFTGWI